MKLLDRKDIAKQRSIEKKIEIDEGAKLARKIDALREAASEEEMKLTKFRVESLKVVHEEIGGAIAQRSLILDEISVAREELKVLRVPLDAEWARVNEKAGQLEELEKRLSDTDEYVREKKKELDIKEKEISLKTQKIDNDIADAEIKQRAANEALKEARKVLARAEEESSKKGQELSLITHQTLHREAAVATFERQLNMRAHSLDSREVELNRRETVINDRYQTLLRSEKRKNV